MYEKALNLLDNDNTLLKSFSILTVFLTKCIAITKHATHKNFYVR